MRKPKRVSLLRSGNRLVIDPTTPRIKDIITPSLRYVEKVYARGREKHIRIKTGRPLFDEVEWECYSEDHKGRLATSFGFQDMIKTHLEARGYEVETKFASEVEASAHKKRLATAYKPQWDRIEELLKNGFEFRHRQKKALRIIAENENGRIDCHTGWGKGTLIMLACLLFPKAKIDVVTKRITVLHTRLYPELAMNLPSVGIIGGGKRIVGKRVMCISADSLHHGRSDADIVFVDEGHEACADGYAQKLGVYDHARMFSFSGSWDMRLDNKDLRGTAMFGPIRLRVSYQEGVEKGIVVPIHVKWSDVIMDENPCSDITDDVQRKRSGIWANEYRNKIIARDAKQYDDKTQTLITVETLEHALHLKRLLPDFTVVYSGQGLKESDVRWFRNHFPDEFEDVSASRLVKRTRRFEKGKLKKAIATSVWNVGVDFRHLEVLIRADAGGSSINDMQIPGRNSRKKRDTDIAKGASEKLVGIVHDYLDQFDSGFKSRATRRSGNYERNQWTQTFPDKKERSKLRQRMNMGSYV